MRRAPTCGQSAARTRPTRRPGPRGGKAPPIQHGFGGVVSVIASYDACDLVHTADLGALAAQQLGSADALLLRGNGVLTVGRTLGEAAARMWSLEERYAQAARQRALSEQVQVQPPMSADDLAARARWYPAEAERIWRWLKYLASSDAARGCTP